MDIDLQNTHNDLLRGASDILLPYLFPSEEQEYVH